MKRKVIKSFTYAPDGKTPRRRKMGRSYEFPVDHAARFEVEGFLEPMPGKPLALREVVGVPDADQPVEPAETAFVADDKPVPVFRKPAPKKSAARK